MLGRWSKMTTPILSLLLALVPALAQAGAEDTFLARLKAKNIRCVENVPTRGAAPDGYFCTRGGDYILIPKDLGQLNQLIFYAHGDTGVCGPGASGEGFLKGNMATLHRIGAIAYFPYRQAARDFEWDMEAHLTEVEGWLGVRQPWTMVGHSFGGKFIGRELEEHPRVIQKVKEIVFLDALYDIRDLLFPPLKTILPAKASIKVRSYHSTTWSKAETFRQLMDSNFPGRYQGFRVTGEHCEAPQYFSKL